VAGIGPDGSGAQGDLVATGGRWWAGWREHVAAGGGPGDEFDQTELFQAYPIGGTYVPRQRVTTNPSWDSGPSLALTPGTTFPVRLVWARGGSDFGGSETDLRRAWATRAAMSGTTTCVTWNRDGRTVQANNASGSFLSRTFTTPAAQDHRPRLAVAPGQVVVGWTTAGTFDAFVAERTGLARVQVLTGVATTGGTATATITSLGSRLYSATEP
jgi:hypothetical protein